MFSGIKRGTQYVLGYTVLTALTFGMLFFGKVLKRSQTIIPPAEPVQ